MLLNKTQPLHKSYNLFRSACTRMSSCVIRRATANDFKGVLDIGTVFGGMDYLPYFYHDFINDPNYISHVCEVEGTIIGYQCGLIHDGGRVIQARAARLIPSYQGKGYGRVLFQGLKDRARNMNIQYLWFATGSDEINWAEFHANPNKKHLYTQKVYNFTMEGQRPMHMPSNMKRLNKRKLEKIFDCSSVCEDLFPRGIIQAHVIALGLDKRNIRHIINDNTSVYVKLSTVGPAERKEFEPESVSTISVGVRYWSPIGQICEISFIGTHIDDLEDHIQAHVVDTPERDSITVGLYVSHSVTQEILDGIYRKFAKTKGKVLGNYHLAVVEYKLKDAMVQSEY